MRPPLQRSKHMSPELNAWKAIAGLADDSAALYMRASAFEATLAPMHSCHAVGRNLEAANHLWELYFGGWVAKLSSTWARELVVPRTV